MDTNLSTGDRSLQHTMKVSSSLKRVKVSKDVDVAADLIEADVCAGGLLYPSFVVAAEAPHRRRALFAGSEVDDAAAGVAEEDGSRRVL